MSDWFWVALCCRSCERKRNILITPHNRNPFPFSPQMGCDLEASNHSASIYLTNFRCLDGTFNRDISSSEVRRLEKRVSYSFFYPDAPNSICRNVFGSDSSWSVGARSEDSCESDLESRFIEKNNWFSVVLHNREIADGIIKVRHIIRTERPNNFCAYSSTEISTRSISTHEKFCSFSQWEGRYSVVTEPSIESERGSDWVRNLSTSVARIFVKSNSYCVGCLDRW